MLRHIHQFYFHSKTTFVTVNLGFFKDTADNKKNSKTTFVTVNPNNSCVKYCSDEIQKQPLLLLIPRF